MKSSTKKSQTIPITVFLIFLLIFVIWNISGKEIYYRSTFADRICKNLVTHYSIPENQCVLSKDVVKVMNNAFPSGTDIHKVEYGMEGFKIILEASGKSQDCNHWERKDYLIIPRWYLLFDESFEFIFCDEKLVNWEYHE